MNSDELARLGSDGIDRDSGLASRHLSQPSGVKSCDVQDAGARLFQQLGRYTISPMFRRFNTRGIWLWFLHLLPLRALRSIKPGSLAPNGDSPN